MDVLWWGSLCLAFLVSVICSLTISAISSHTPTRVEEGLKSSGERRRFDAYLPLTDRYFFSAILINIVADAVLVLVAAGPRFADAFEEAGRGGSTALLGPALVVVSALAFTLVFGEVLPRAIGEAHADTLLPRLLPWIAFMDRALLPVTWPLHALHRGIASLFTQPIAKERIADEILSATQEGEREGVLDEDEASMIESIIELKDAEVREVMTPRTEMVCLDIEASVDAAIELILDGGHSRIPVYVESRDRIVGILYAKDLLGVLRISTRTVPSSTSPVESKSVRSLMRKPYFVPVSKSIRELLKEFRTRNVHIAIVLDEYGGTAGLVTIEDILEEIVGEIGDEFDDPEIPTILRVDPTTAEVDAKLRIAELNEELGLTLPEQEEYETLGGFVMHTLGKVPLPGESFIHSDVRFTVLAGDARRVTRVRVEQLSGQLAG